MGKPRQHSAWYWCAKCKKYVDRDKNGKKWRKSLHEPTGEYHRLVLIGNESQRKKHEQRRSK